jgi:hypothetical protein
MRKVQVTAVFWTMLLAVPFTAFALSLAAYTTEHMSEMIAWVASVSQATTVGGRGWLLELSARWPEVVGMIVGQIIIMTILIFARQAGLAEDQSQA